MGTVCQGRQCASKLDDIPIAVVPLIEEREVLEDLVNWRHHATYIRLRRGNGQKSSSEPAGREKPVNWVSRPPGVPRALPGAVEAAQARASRGPCRPELGYLPIRAWPFRLMHISRGAWRGTHRVCVRRPRPCGRARRQLCHL